MLFEVLLIISIFTKLTNCDFCGYPGSPVNGSVYSFRYQNKIRFFSVFYPNDTIRYSCDEFCRIIGDEKRKCQNDGYWSGNIPLCDCPFTTIKTSQSSTYEQTFELTNYSSYSAIDHNLITCSLTKLEITPSWKAYWRSPVFIQYIRIKPREVTIEDLNVMVFDGINWIICTVFQSGFYWTYQCPENIGATRLTIIKNTPEESFISLCEVFLFTSKDNYPCGKPELPINSKFNKTGTKYHYYCNKGFIKTHDYALECLKNGSWSSKAPRCLSPRCKGYPGLENGNVTKNVHYSDGSEKSGTLLEVICHEGYKLSHNKSIVCGLDGNWNGTVECLPILCKTIPSILNGKLIYESMRYLSKARVECKTGFKVVGDGSFITCLVNESWSAPTPQCKLIDCGRPTLDTKTYKKYFNNITIYGSVFTVMCHSDSSRKNLVFRCGEFGQWTITRYSCHGSDNVEEEIGNIYLIIGIALVSFLTLVVVIILIICWSRSCREVCLNVCKKKIREEYRSNQRESNNGLVPNEHYEEISDKVRKENRSNLADDTASEHIYTELENIQSQDAVYAEPDLQTHYAVTLLDGVNTDNEQFRSRTLTSSYQVANYNRNNNDPQVMFSPYKQRTINLKKREKSEALSTETDDTYFVEENPIYS